MLKNKGQIGVTMTWVIVTIIILVILAIFLYASSLLAVKTKIIQFTKTAESFAQDVELGRWLFVKTKLAHDVDGRNKNEIDNFLKQQNANS